jgi:acetamidase/formamidase
VTGGDGHRAQKSQYLDTASTHSVWSSELTPILYVQPGETFEVETSLGGGARYLSSATPDDVREVTRTATGLALTGPIFVEGAELGDVVAIELREISISDWGYTVIAPGFGLLAEEFPEPAVRLWDLSNGTTTPFNDNITIPLEPFLGTIGVAPPSPAVLPTIPPSKWGGNLDTKRMTRGAIVFLPVGTAGALVSLGDAHGAQGDGEVCGSAIETSCVAALRITLHKNTSIRFPMFRSLASRQQCNGPATHSTTGIGSDLYVASQEAVRGMIDWLVRNCKITPVEAYFLCSVCVDLSVNEIVDQPSWVVAANLPLSVFRQTPPAQP